MQGLEFGQNIVLPTYLRSAYTDDTIKKLNGNAVPNVPGSPAERLQQHSISVDLSVPLEPPVSNVPILSLPADTSQQHLIPVSVLPPQPTVPNMPILVLPDPSQEPVVLESKQEQLKKCKKYLNKIYSLKRALKKKKNATKSRKCFVETLSGTDKYRKCVKCGASAFQDPTLTFHSFPRAGKASNYARLRIWADYCFANVSEDVLKSLHKSHKLLCSRHFDRSAYTDDTMKKLNGNAVPNVPGSLAETLQQHSISVICRDSLRN
ncbi:uncharacterized protein [Maniola hyperantus]|uniref:uncharacterized protein n=1 Tax=Aphantopus hyperantus TaxID=2795564 RepID=UPI00213C5063